MRRRVPAVGRADLAAVPAIADPRGSVVGPSACLPDFGTASLERGASGARADARKPRIGPCESHGAPAGPLDLRNARGRSADHKASRMLPPWPPDRAPAWRASLGWWARPRPRILDLRRRRCSGRCGRGQHGEIKKKPTVTLHTTAAFFIVGNRLYTQLLGPEAHQRAHTGHRTAQFLVGAAGMGPCCRSTS